MRLPSLHRMHLHPYHLQAPLRGLYQRLGIEQVEGDLRQVRRAWGVKPGGRAVEGQLPPELGALS